MYADAVEWVTLPNALGMSQHADGGVIGSKPYAAGGAYIKRMCNYCAGCRYRPEQRSGDECCPFSNFYWDFIIRHEKRFERNPRMALPVRQARAMPKEERVRITVTAAGRRRTFGIGDISSGASERGAPEGPA
jgi:deoxyribodipyrimidine photolyase-related protein